MSASGKRARTTDSTVGAAGRLLSKLPGALLSLVFAWLPLRDNRALARCTVLLRRVGALAVSSPCLDAVNVRVTDFDSTDEPTQILARVATMLPRHLTVHYKLVDMTCLQPVLGMTTLRSLVLLCRLPARTAGLWRLTALTSLRVSYSLDEELVDSIAACATLRRLHFGCRHSWTKFAPFTALTRLESITLENMSDAAANMSGALFRLPAVTELGLLQLLTDRRDGLATLLPNIPAAWGAQLRRLVLHGPFAFSPGYGCVRDLGSSLTSLDVTYTGTGLPQILIGYMRSLEEVTLRYRADHLGASSAWNSPGDLARFELMRRLRSLTLERAHVADLARFGNLPACFAELRLVDCENLVSLDGLAPHVQLHLLDVLRCARLGSVRALASAPHLTSLSLLECPELCAAGQQGELAARVNSLAHLRALRLDFPHDSPLLDAARRRLAFGGGSTIY